jgi:hypothetical protein
MRLTEHCNQRKSTALRRISRPFLLIAAAATAACHYDQYSNPVTPLPTFTIEQLGVLAGGTTSEATSGSASTIVGWATDAGNQPHAVTFAGGHALRLIEPVGASGSEANAINVAGIIVGAATIGGTQRAIVWSSASASPTILPTLGGAFGIAQSINDQNIIAGASQTSAGDTVIVLWQPGNSQYVVAPLDSGSGVGWEAISVNDNMDVAGNLGGNTSASGGFYANPDIGVDTIVSPAAGVTVAHGMNQVGIVVGAIVAGSSPPQAFAFTDAASTVVLGIPPAGYTGVVANSITNNGIVAGTATTTDAGGNPLTSVTAIASLTNLSATFVPLPTLGGAMTRATDNGVTPCGVILGQAAANAAMPAAAAVAWVPAGCTIP